MTLTIWGTWLTMRHMRGFAPFKAHLSSRRRDPVTILKPVKGAEPDFPENLESFFRLDYPKYELLISIAEENDPAREIIERTIAKFPRVRAKLFIGEIKAGPNPKVNNLIKSFNEARHDWILISDSNVRVEIDYLDNVTEGFSDDVGVVTAIVRGGDATTPGAWLESMFLNTFCARWMILASRFGAPVVVGKSMLFRKSEAARFGGMTTLSKYLAEDYMAGQAMKLLGRRVSVMRKPVLQPLGDYKISAFWARHLRWGRIRKAQSPLAFVFEPMMTMWISGVVGMMSVASLIGVSRLGFLAAHALAWLTLDLTMIKILGGRVRLSSVPAWLARETLYLPLWIHIGLGRSVNWRGHKLALTRGGMLKV